MLTFKRTLGIVTTGMILSVAALPSLAGGKYTYVEARFVADAEFDGSSEDADGFRFAGSYKFNNQVYGAAEYEAVEFDGRNDVDFDIMRFGAGFIHPLNQQWDINAEAHLIRMEIDTRFGDDSDTGFSIAGGVRGMATPEIEVKAMLILEDVEDRDSYITVGADYYFQPNVSAGIEMDLAGDYETFSIGAKFHF